MNRRSTELSGAEPFHTLMPSNKNFAVWPFTSVNHNVVTNIGMKFSFGLADGIWSGTVLANYLFHIGGNEYAGYAEAAMGLASLVVALPAGWAADRGSKAHVIAVGGLLVPLAVALTSFAVIWSYNQPTEKQKSFWLFVGGLCLWGAVQSIANGPAQALYADSIAQGERSRYFMYSFSLYMAASVLGPIISIFLFVAHNDTWEPSTLRTVFLVGQGLELLGGAAMLCFKERCALDDTPPSAAGAPPAAAPATMAVQPLLAPWSNASAPAADAAAGSPAAEAAQVEADDAEAADIDARSIDVSSTIMGASDAAATAASPAPHPLAWSVPYTLFASSLMMGFASGMTIKFFPLYFRCSCGMSPAAVQGVYAAVPLLLAAFSKVGTCAAKRIGRAQVLVVFKVVGIALLVAMALLEDWLQEGVASITAADVSGDCSPPTSHGGVGNATLGGTRGSTLTDLLPSLGGAPSRHFGASTVAEELDIAGDSGSGAPTLLERPPFWKVSLIVLIYLLRTALMNCTYPLNSSILMDFTPKHTRARWQSLGSIVRFGWCGSAALGGVLADRYGYSSTFLVTAGVQMVGTVLQLLLWPIVPRVEGGSKAAASDSPGAIAPPTTICTSSGNGREPLLDEPRVRGSIQDGQPVRVEPVGKPRRRG